MIYVVHGEDTVKSRAALVNQQKKLNTSRIDLNIKNCSPQQLFEQCSTTSLFGENPFIVFDLSDANKNALEPYIDTLAKIPSSATLILFSSKSLPKSHILFTKLRADGFKQMEFEKFAEGNVFKFVDALFSKNRKAAYFELAKLNAEEYDDFYTMSMIYFGMRGLAKVAWQSPSANTMKPFQLSKLSGQLRLFSPEKLKNIFAELYTLEKKAKTGGLPAQTMVTMAVEKVLNS